MKKFLMINLFLLVIFSAFPTNLFAAEKISDVEREAFALRVELNRIGNSGDPFEREAILRKIIDISKGTEEGENAYWDLADLYLDGFPEEMRKEAIETLELCLRAYPNSSRAAMTKCKLIDLYDAKDSRRAELVQQVQNDKTLPAVLRNSIK